jgi:hypothetical protein
MLGGMVIVVVIVIHVVIVMLMNEMLAINMFLWIVLVYM